MKISARVIVYPNESLSDNEYYIENIFSAEVSKAPVYEGFTVNRTVLNNLGFCFIHSGSSRNALLKIETKGEATVFVFANRETCFGKNHLFRQCKSCGKRFNLFYLNGENSFKVKFDSIDRNDFLCIFLSKNLYRQMVRVYPDLSEFDNPEEASNSITPLLEPGDYFSYDICHVIGQIQHIARTDEASSLIMESKILELFAHLLKLKAVRKKQTLTECLMKKVFTAKEILDSNYQKPPSIHELALSIGTNDTTLKKSFKNLFRTTVYGYLFDSRMEKAKAMLMNNELSIREVAESIGYTSQSNFSTAFKRKFGVPPGAFLNTDV
jgi:AraC-like DNA-binding protein